jgi:pimeloyl-ACP methyl ester carboxylesterase
MVAAACGGFERSQQQAATDAVFGWEELGERTEQGSITVPVDYAKPDGDVFDLYVVRHLAEPERRIGTLLVNPGGPGFGGSALAQFAPNVFSPTIVASFDIVGWDPRGTGLTTPTVDCIDDIDRYFGSYDITPDDDAERQVVVKLAEDFAAGCTDAAPWLTQVGTTNSARDLDAIRAGLGEDTISYFGFSYGSELGAVWATMFPDTVRAVVFDGAVDPLATTRETSRQQSLGFEQALERFLARCAGDRKCAFHRDGKSASAFDDLMIRLDEQPIPALDDRPPLTRAMAITGVAQAMYRDALWPSLATALDAADRGDGKALMALYDGYFGLVETGLWGNELEAFSVITCMDDSERPSVASDDAFAAELNDVAPRLSPGTVGSYQCSFLPPTAEPRATIAMTLDVPVVVIGTTGDAATPLAGTRAMAAAASDGRLVVVDANQHIGYDVSQCARDLVDAYLLDPIGDAPPKETSCS